MHAGEGRDLVRALATILCVHKGMSLTKPVCNRGCQCDAKILGALDFHSWPQRPDIVVDFSCILLLITKIFDGFTKIESLLPGLTGGDEFGFRGRQTNKV